MALWWTYFAVDAAEIEPLWSAAGERLPPNRYAIGSGEEFGEEGGPEFVLGVDAGSLSGAIRSAQRQWGMLRTEAGLPKVTGRRNQVEVVIGPLDAAAPLHDTLLLRARQLLRDEPSYALVAAVSAFEVYVRGVVRDIARLKMPDEIAELFREKAPKWLREALLQGLIGKELKDAGEPWDAYQASLRSRNRIVHDGGQVDQGAAATALQAVQDLIDWIEDSVLRSPR